jgi:GSH-dependent disulfide-bond oxidoreductase
MLELYHWEPNGSWLKPLIALHEKGLEFRSRYVEVLSFEQHRPDFLQPARETALPLEGEGPILVHEGRQITESLFIMEYLEDAYPQRPLRPAQPILHARILAWGRFINEVLMPAVSTLGCHAFLGPQLKAQSSTALPARVAQLPSGYLREGWQSALANDYPQDLLEDSRRKVALGVRRLEDALASTPWLLGTSYTLADIDAFSICNALPTLTPELVSASATPQLLRWLTRIRERPAVRAALGTSRTGRPEQAFAPGPEHSRWG